MTLPLFLGCWLSLAAAPAPGPTPPVSQEERPEQEPADPWAYYRDKYDEDGDGEISRKEYGRPREYFDQLDRNDDGVLTAADWKGKVGKDPKGKDSKGKQPKRAKALKVGQRAPKFELPILELLPEGAGEGGSEEVGDDAEKDAKQNSKKPKTIKLSDYTKNDRPVALIFGSYT